MKLEIKNLTKCYHDKLALDHVNYTFTTGVYGLLGSNGAGKTTLINLLTDNISRTNGTILWDGRDILKAGRQYRAKVGYMPQQQGRIGDLTVVGFLNEIGRLKGMSSRQIRQESEEWLEKVNLTEYRYKKVDHLSGGMKQRVLLAQALMNSPEILILDEPTAGLDPRERIRIRNLIYSLSSDRLVLIATHIVSDIEYIADQVLIMKNGQLVISDSPNKLEAGIADKLHEIPCDQSNLERIQEEHPIGRILLGTNGIVYRYVSDESKAEKTDRISLEDVYMYYALT